MHSVGLFYVLLCPLLTSADVFAGGLAVTLARLSSPLANSLGRQRLEQSWLLCQEILGHFSTFSNSAQKSLHLLKRVHSDVMARVAGACLRVLSVAISLTSEQKHQVVSKSRGQLSLCPPHSWAPKVWR